MKAIPLHRTREIETLVREHQSSVRGYLVVAGCPADRVDDLCQDVFLSLLSSRFEPRSPAETRSFLRKVARHLLIRTLERERRGFSVADERELDRAERIWDEAEGVDGGSDYMEALRKCLAVLEGRAGRVLELRYAAGVALIEIAEELGLRVSSVKSLLVRTRHRLRDCIERRLHA